MSANPLVTDLIGDRVFFKATGDIEHRKGHIRGMYTSANGIWIIVEESENGQLTKIELFQVQIDRTINPIPR